jgi:hypothetical protein
MEFIERSEINLIKNLWPGVGAFQGGHCHPCMKKNRVSSLESRLFVGGQTLFM